jgi:hypothetical protein
MQSSHSQPATSNVDRANPGDISPAAGRRALTLTIIGALVGLLALAGIAGYYVFSIVLPILEEGQFQ